MKIEEKESTHCLQRPGDARRRDFVILGQHNYKLEKNGESHIRDII